MLLEFSIYIYIYHENDIGLCQRRRLRQEFHEVTSARKRTDVCSVCRRFDYTVVKTSKAHGSQIFAEQTRRRRRCCAGPKSADKKVLATHGPFEGHFANHFAVQGVCTRLYPLLRLAPYALITAFILCKPLHLRLAPFCASPPTWCDLT